MIGSAWKNWKIMSAIFCKIRLKAIKPKGGQTVTLFRYFRWITTAAAAALLAVGFWGTVQAKEYPALYRGIRPLGMGNAFTAVAQGHDALFYNPAGLSNISTLSFGVLNPMVEISDKITDIQSDIDDTDMDDSGEVADLLREYVGEHQHAKTGLYPYVGFNIADYGVMISGIGQASIDAEAHNPTWPEMHTDIVVDYGILAGAGAKLPFFDLRVGAALKLLHRESLEQVYTAADIADDDFEDRIEDDLKSGSGVSLDVGVLYTLPYFKDVVKTDVALAVQNIPKMDFGDARDAKTQANIGVAVEKQFAKFSLIGAMDYRDLTQSIGEESDFPKRLHMGVEFRLPTILSVRAGLNQGYGTMGATLDLWFFKLDLATYAEEVGAYAGQREDRRYAGQLSFGW